MATRHEPSCTCDLCVAWRGAKVQNANPMMRKSEPKPTSILIPREVALANAREELQFHLLCAGKWRAEVERLGDME
jgi:hypothetical protein